MLDGTTTAGDLESRLTEAAALRDISVLEPDIEDVVARLSPRRRTEVGSLIVIGAAPLSRQVQK